jgi:hypothetical protein
LLLLGFRFYVFRFFAKGVKGLELLKHL